MTLVDLAPLHIAINALLIIFGFSALALKKGSRPHRLAGNLFFAVMVAMFVTGVYLVVRNPTLERVAWTAMSTVYLALTGWTTARRRERGVGPLEIGGMLLGVAIVLTGLVISVQALRHPPGVNEGPPAVFFLIISGLVVLFTALDISVIVRGGIAGAQRTARHVWRMGLAVTISTASIFLSQADQFPEPIRPFLQLPALLALGLTVFWLVKTLRGRKRAAAVQSV